jgi:hypothetical protein
MKNRNFLLSLSATVECVAALCLLTIFVGCGSGSNHPVLPAPTAAGPGAGAGGSGKGPAPVNLGTASNYAVLAESTITSVPTSVITGNVGLSPAAGSFIVLSCTEVVGGGHIYAVDASGPSCAINDAVPGNLTTAITDKNTARVDANGRAADYNELAAGLIGGLNLGPATYKWTSAVSITSDLTLTGGPNDVWIFIIAQGLTLSSGVHITLAGGALPANIYWSVAEAATLDTTSTFNGTLISQTNIAAKTLAVINGRLLAHTAVTLDSNSVTAP